MDQKRLGPLEKPLRMWICEAAMGGAGAGDLIFHSLCGKKKALDVGGPSSIDCKYFWGSNKKQRSCDGRGGAQRPVWRGNEPKKTDTDRTASQVTVAAVPVA